MFQVYIDVPGFGVYIYIYRCVCIYIYMPLACIYIYIYISNESRTNHYRGTLLGLKTLQGGRCSRFGVTAESRKAEDATWAHGTTVYEGGNWEGRPFG